MRFLGHTLASVEDLDVASFAIKTKAVPYFREERTTYSLPHKCVSCSDIRKRQPANEPASDFHSYGTRVTDHGSCFCGPDEISHDHGIGSRLQGRRRRAGQSTPHVRTYGGLQGIKNSLAYS